MLKKEPVLLLELVSQKMESQNQAGALRLHPAGIQAQQAHCQTVMAAQIGEKMSQIV